MDNQPECFVSGPFANFLRLSRFVGMAPLRFTKQPNGWKINISNYYYVFGFLILCIIYMITDFGIISTLLKKQSLDWSVWTVTFFVSMGLVGTLVFSSRTKMECLIVALKRVQQINTELCNNIWPWTMKNIAVFVICNFISILTIISFSVIILIQLCLSTDIFCSGWPLFIWAMNFILFVMIDIGTVSFCLLVLHVGNGFKTVNDYLNKLLYVSSWRHLPTADVRRACKAYSAACDTVKAVNEYYGLTLFLLLACSHVNLVSAPYYFITGLMTDKNASSERSFNAFLYNLWLFYLVIYHAINLIRFIEPCHMTHLEMESTREIISCLIRKHSMRDPLLHELDKFSKQIALHEISYKPLKVVKLSRSLVLKIFASAVTYLVILVNTKQNKMIQ